MYDCPVVVGVSLNVAAALTDALYPYFSAQLRADQLIAVSVLTARNAVLVVMLLLAIAGVIRLARRGPSALA